VVVEIGQQRGAGSAHSGMNIAVDPRGRHGASLRFFVSAILASRL
jgi:apolipoprotein N-acyltransferase